MFYKCHGSTSKEMFLFLIYLFLVNHPFSRYYMNKYSCYVYQLQGLWVLCSIPVFVLMSQFQVTEFISESALLITCIALKLNFKATLFTEFFWSNAPFEISAQKTIKSEVRLSLIIFCTAIANGVSFLKGEENKVASKFNFTASEILVWKNYTKWG